MIKIHTLLMMSIMASIATFDRIQAMHVNNQEEAFDALLDSIKPRQISNQEKARVHAIQEFDDTRIRAIKAFAYDDDTAAVQQQLLLPGTNSNIICTTLRSAVNNGHISVVKLLLNTGISLPNCITETIYKQAAMKGHPAIVDLALTTRAGVPLPNRELLLNTYNDVEDARENEQMTETVKRTILNLIMERSSTNPDLGGPLTPELLAAARATATARRMLIAQMYI
ncbi:MAG: hypothetical protein WCJ92_02180 [Alphaproteobacteria bacterium]